MTADPPPKLGIVERIVALHDALRRAQLPHAFGGALALAWCTERARGTIDIDLNAFVESSRSAVVFDALPAGVQRSDHDLMLCLRDGQVRLWWDQTPIDLFTNTTSFHVAASQRAVVHSFASRQVPFLGCGDLAVFKAFFNRTKDWADLEAMLQARTLDADAVLGPLTHYLGGDDERVARFRALVLAAN